MKIPEHVYVMGHKFTIAPMSDNAFMDSEMFGECNVNRRVISIYDNAHDTIIRDTLLHEILHACWHMLSLNKSEEEEKTVNSLSTLLIGIIDDPRNKEVVDLIINNT